MRSLNSLRIRYVLARSLIIAFFRVPVNRAVIRATPCYPQGSLHEEIERGHEAGGAANQPRQASACLGLSLAGRVAIKHIRNTRPLASSTCVRREVIGVLKRRMIDIREDNICWHHKEITRQPLNAIPFTQKSGCRSFICWK